MNRYVVLAMLIFSSISAQVNSKLLFEESRKLSSQKQFDKALDAINNALKLDSTNKDYLLQKTSVLYLSSRCDEAMDVLNQAYELNNSKVDDEILICFTDIYD